MAESIAVLLPAAGAGERLGQGPKAFVEIGGRPLLSWTLDALAAWADQVVVAVPPGAGDRGARVASGAEIVPGGATRQDTVARLLDHTSAEWVLVHDAARPFLPAAVRDRVVAAAKETGAASASLSLRDSVVDATTGATIDRDRLRAVQTPQVFRRELLAHAHLRATQSGETATDDAALVRKVGHGVTLVEGSPWLFKITTPQDLELARGLVGVWRDR